jgi:hypothetical protein
VNEAILLSKKKAVCAKSVELFLDQLSNPKISKSLRSTPNSVGGITVAREQARSVQDDKAENFYEMGSMIGPHIPASAG